MIAKKLQQPQFIWSVLIPIGTLVFFTSLFIASIFYYRGRSFSPRDAVISKLQSAFDNPSGYLIAAAGTAGCALLILPAARLFFVGLRHVNRRLAAAGSVLTALGLLLAVVVVGLAPFFGPYDTLHIVLAFATFIALSVGLTLCLGLAAWSTRRVGLMLMTLIQFTALLVLVYMLFSPDFPPERSLLTSLAFLEWCLCLALGASIVSLTALLAASAPPKTWQADQ